MKGDQGLFGQHDSYHKTIVATKLTSEVCFAAVLKCSKSLRYSQHAGPCPRLPGHWIGQVQGEPEGVVYCEEGSAIR